MAPINPPAPSDPPNPWMYVRLMRQGEHDHMLAIDEHMRKALSVCDRCITIYVTTGLIPVSCHVCGAQRDESWLACVEANAREQPRESTLATHVPGARPAIATGRTPLRQIG